MARKARYQNQPAGQCPVCKEPIWRRKDALREKVFCSDGCRRVYNHPDYLKWRNRSWT